MVNTYECVRVCTHLYKCISIYVVVFIYTQAIPRQPLPLLEQLGQHKKISLFAYFRNFVTAKRVKNEDRQTYGRGATLGRREIFQN